MLTKAKRHKLSFPILMISSLLFSGHGYAKDEDKDWQINLLSEYFLQGDYGVTYDAVIGGELVYFFSHKQAWHHFFKSGYRRNTEQNGAALNLYNIDIGSKFDITTLWERNLFIEYSVGAVYSDEKFSTQLIDRKATSRFSDWNFQSAVGIGMDFNEQFSSKIYVNQIGATATSIGVSFSVIF